MLNKLIVLTLASTILFVAPIAAQEVGKPAPDFKLTDSNGKQHALADFKGKYVVLEWHNDQCPFVVKHYSSGNMQKLQETYSAKDVVWLTINSSAEGKQGYLTAEKGNELLKEVKSKATALLLDHDGSVGQAYGAKTTPHMFVINPEGTLIYAGAIDSKNSTDPADIAGATNYVAQALDQAMTGKAVELATTAPYGCSVKYASKGWFFG